MIFDTNFESNSALYSLEGVSESQYDLGIGGALMHVWENECNYNSLMRAVGISELKYYNENHASLFVQEAGAFKGFIEKVKAFFQKVIEKIKSIFKKFVATIGSFTMKDKDFIKKYEKDILRNAGNLKDFEFNGYKKLMNVTFSIKDVHVPTNPTADEDEDKRSNEDIDASIESRRGAIIGANKGRMDESEFRDALKEELYGDKESFEVSSADVRTALTTIKGTKDSIKTVEKQEKDIIKKIDEYIKALDKVASEYNKGVTAKAMEADDKLSGKADNVQKHVNNSIKIWKAYSNDLTVAFGALTNAHKEANRQAKAICVKVMSYKKKEEAATVSESTNIFDMVDFA